MILLIKNARIVEAGKPVPKETKDILVESGRISAIKKKITAPKKARVIESENLHVSIGWFDFRANFCDPGFEEKEDIETGLKAAAAGGFTGVATLPNTNPVRDSKSGVEYAIKRASGNAVQLVPLAAISKGIEGKELSELFDMLQSGAPAFTDGTKPVQDPNLMMRALLYARGFNGLVMNMPDEHRISLDGKMNEGKTSTELGLKGIPSIAEELMVARDLYLLGYTGSRLHLGPISTAQSVKLVREAKKSNAVTAEVGLANLVYDDEKLNAFDSNYKVFPPLRSKQDIKALLKGISNGTVDVISSNHSPENVENKDREFDHAAFGITMLETFYPLYNTHLSKEIDLGLLLEKIAVNPRKVLSLDIPVIKKGAAANLTLFDPGVSWTYGEATKQSKSANSPESGQKLKGKVLGIVNGTKTVLND